MKHAQIHQTIVAAGFAPAHKTSQVQYYAKGATKVQLFHEGLWKRMPDRVEIVTNFAVQGCEPRKDKWYQFATTNAEAFKAFLGRLEAETAPQQEQAASPTMTEEDVHQLLHAGL